MAYTNIDDPSAYFQALTYTGNGTTTNNVTNTGNSNLQPDWVWIKQRSATQDHVVTDSSRDGEVASGTNLVLTPNTTEAEASSTGFGINYATNGINFDAAWAKVNASGQTYVAWQWKANAGTTSSNTDGSITSTVQANQDAGFSIITYTGTGGGETFGHGLGVAPDMWIVKRRSGTGSWAVGFNDANILGGTSKYLILQSTGATSTYNNFWGSSPASSTVMRIAGDATIGGSGSTYVAYAFAEKQGYSKFGSYVGNGSADGPFIYTGFKPAFFLLKKTSAADGWRLFDNKRAGYNDDNYRLAPDDATAEDTATTYLDILSNGVKIRGTAGSFNQSGGSYIYMAFAENPFVTSTGIPTTAR